MFNIFIYFSSLHVSGIQVPIISRKLLYLCDTGICHSVWVASGLLVGFNIQPADQTPLIVTYNSVAYIQQFSADDGHMLAPKHVEMRNK